MIPGFTEKDIIRTCGHTYTERGRHYQRTGRVLMVEVAEDGATLVGVVQGSAGQRYRLSIVVEGVSRGAQIEGRCSCPMRFECKHVAAVLLEYLHRQLPFRRGAAARQVGSAPPDELQIWWQRLNEKLARPEAAQRGAGTAQQLVYVLQVRTLRRDLKGSEVLVAPFRSRPLKRGGWGKFSPASWYQLAGSGTGYRYAPNWQTSLDGDIIGLLQGRISWDFVPRIEGDVGLLLLKRLLQTGRCFLEGNTATPLALGPACPARFAWKARKDQQLLEVSLEGVEDPWLPLPTDPPWYLDLAGNRCGPIEQPLQPLLFNALCQLPPVPEPRLPELARLLASLAPADALSLPVELHIERWQGTPIPVLRLLGQTSRTGDVVHLARLWFDYGPCRLRPWHPGDDFQPLLQQDGRDWLIQRDAAAEVGHRQRLEGIGLVPALQTGAGEAGEYDLLFTGRTVAACAQCWRQFLQAEVPRLVTEGWRVETEVESFRLRFEQAAELTARVTEGETGWFEVGLDLAWQGRTIPLLPLLLQALEEGTDPAGGLLLDQGEGRWLEVPAAVLAPVLDTLFELYGGLALGRGGEVRLHRSLSPWLEELDRRMAAGGSQLAWQGGRVLRELGSRLRNFQGIRPVPAPAGLDAELRPYQLQGLAWLQFLREFGFGGILADDMGLGKTIQALAHLLLEREAGRLTRPVLVVTPTSVLGNWQRETQRFAPDLRVLLLHGPQRSDWFERIGEFDLVVTSYALLARDGEVLCRSSWHTVILDEAQAIKNARTQAAKVAAALPAEQRLCLTGTPLENHLGELWSLFHFSMPGFLGQEKTFNSQFRTPVEKRGDELRRQELVRRITPFVLRRTKEMVASELPAKSEMVENVELEGAQRRLYESIRVAMAAKVSALLSQKGLARSHIEMLDALLKLRQVCCDPRLVKLESARGVDASAKLGRLLEMLESLLEDGRRILLFSQFSSMLALIEAELQKRRIDYLKLTGQTRKRQELIDRFQQGTVPLFLISLKAGGVGLNLTAADTVIHYDPWWNPAVERQATDRAHRIGQEKPVFVYKLVATGTVEEKILQMQARKQALADGIYGQGEGEAMAALSSEEILSLFAP
jgi:SNF2-related domain/Helicase conserved C-terminal domain